MLLELKNSCHFKIFPKMRQSLKITQLATLAPMWSHWLLLPPLLTVTMKATFVEVGGMMKAVRPKRDIKTLNYY